MTELERAHINLKNAQWHLRQVREDYWNSFGWPVAPDQNAIPLRETDVLVALSWLWDAQERFAAEGWNSVALKGELKALGIDMPAWVSSGSPDKANSRHP